MPALAPPPGRELFRFATISDLHIGDTSFGYLGTIRERPAPADPFPVRAARGAIDELAAWARRCWCSRATSPSTPARPSGTRSRRSSSASTARCSGCPATTTRPTSPRAATATTVRPPTSSTPAHGLRRAGIDTELVQVADVDGLRIVLGDTNRSGHKSGQVAHIASDLLDAVADADRPVLVGLHHQLMTAMVPTYLPVGIRRSEAAPFLDALAQVRPDTLVTSGHTHRHRRRRYGPLTLTEVGSTKDYPGTWAGYVVHEGGIRQVVDAHRRPGRDGVDRTHRRGGARRVAALVPRSPRRPLLLASPGRRRDDPGRRPR